MTILLALFGILLSLLLVIGLHEAGHALAAVCFRVKIERFSIGFGKPLFLYKSKNGMEWVFARWPIGGYVKLSPNHIKPITARIIILLSGAAINFIVAWCAFTLFYMLPHQNLPAEIKAIIPQTAAEKAGFKPGEVIIQVGDKATPSWQMVGMEIIKHLHQTHITLTVQDKSQAIHTRDMRLCDWRYQPQKHALMRGFGIEENTSKNNIQKLNGLGFKDSMYQALYMSCYLALFLVNIIKLLITGALPLGVLLGPIGLLGTMSGAFLAGLSTFLYFIASFSIALAIANLLPIPGLDGGSIIYAVVEGIRKKPMSEALEALLHRLSFIAFCVFMTQLLINDVERLLH